MYIHIYIYVYYLASQKGLYNKIHFNFIVTEFS